MSRPPALPGHCIDERAVHDLLDRQITGRCNERAIAIRRRHAGLREIPGAERRFLDWKAGFVVREPLRQRHCNFWRILVFAAA